MRPKILLLLIVVLGVLEIFSLSRQLFKLVSAGGRITQAQERLDKAKKENEMLNKQLTYYQSQDFLEKEARDKLNLAHPGETMVIIPKDLIQLYLQENQLQEKTVPEKPNWLKWKEAFFGG